jgi:hypothetical protein
MKKEANSKWQSIMLFAAIAALVLSFGAQTKATAQGKLRVGDHVEEPGVYKGTVTEIGTGNNKNCYRMRSDNAANPEYQGDLVCTFGLPNILFLLDANGKRVRDVNAPEGVQATTNQPVGETDAEKQPHGNGKQNPTADAEQGGFKEGARVEGQFGSKWNKCTVVEHRLTGGYTLRCDNKPLEESVYAASQVRAMQSPDADGGKGAAETVRRTTEQAIAQCSGEPLLDLKTKGRAASATLFGEVIRSMFDQEAKGEERIHKVVTKIESIQVGAPYRWRPGTDAQQLGQAKTVYPVKVSFITCDDGQFDWRTAEYQRYNYSCRVDETANGEWSCTTYGLGTTKSKVIPKQAGNDINTGGRQKP